jgi:hypothetical protein
MSFIRVARRASFGVDFLQRCFSAFGGHGGEVNDRFTLLHERIVRVADYKSILGGGKRRRIVTEGVGNQAELLTGGDLGSELYVEPEDPAIESADPRRLRH